MNHYADEDNSTKPKTNAEKAIAVAQEGFDKVSQHKNNDDESNTSQHNETPEVEYDPDDLAAAFFAAQAKKEKKINELPFKEWSTLFPNLKLSNDSDDERNIKSTVDSSLTEIFNREDDAMETAAKIRIKMKEKLVNMLVLEMKDHMNEAFRNK